MEGSKKRIIRKLEQNFDNISAMNQGRTIIIYK